MRISDWSSDVCSSDLDAAIVETPSPMRIPLFRAMWTASLISNLGAVMQTVGASWMMASLTDSPQLIALVQSSTALPIVFLSLWSGAVADNLDRRRIMLSAQLLMLAVSIELTIYAFNGWLTTWLLLRSEEHTSELQSSNRITYSVF